mgnify:CR=1 FL=1
MTTPKPKKPPMSSRARAVLAAAKRLMTAGCIGCRLIKKLRAKA